MSLIKGKALTKLVFGQGFLRLGNMKIAINLNKNNTHNKTLYLQDCIFKIFL